MLLGNDLRLDTNVVRRPTQCWPLDFQAQLDAKGMVQDQAVKIARDAYLGLIEKVVKREIIMHFSPKLLDRRASVIQRMRQLLSSFKELIVFLC